MPRRYGKRRRLLVQIVLAYKAAPAFGNSTDENLRRTEYVLALEMLAKMAGEIDAKKNK